MRLEFNENHLLAGGFPLRFSELSGKPNILLAKCQYFMVKRNLRGSWTTKTHPASPKPHHRIK